MNLTSPDKAPRNAKLGIGISKPSGGIVMPRTPDLACV
jgi:hypothetical protein